MTYEYSGPAGAGASSTQRAITAFFDDRNAAEAAVARLKAEGVPPTDISVVAGGEQRAGTSGVAESEARGFWEELKDMFFPDEDRHVYAEGLRRGGYLVTVRTLESRYDRVMDILDDEGSIDLSQRETEWRSKGWSGYEGADYRALPGGSTRDAKSGGEVIPVTEETLKVGKRDVSHGRVKIRSYVVETPVNQQVNLREEKVSVERRPVDRAVTAGDEAFRNRTIEVEQRAEEAVIAKEARVTEEVVVNKQVEQRAQNVTDTVRKTKVEVEDERAGGIGNRTPPTTPPRKV